MNVGAIGGYSPISYISPYEGTRKIGPEELAGTTGSEQKLDVQGKAVEKTDPNYKCETCANRKYQDGSDENDVSFKSASHVSPEAAPAAVRSHEQQHVSNAYEKAEKGNGKVISASVTIHTSVCPECGKTYVAGGTTKTTIKYTNEENPYQKNLKELQAGFLRGNNIDMEV